MANVDVIPTAQNLPDGACFTSWQDAANAFAAALRVTLPSDYGQIIISQTTPDPGDRDKIWFEVDASNHVLAIRSWDSTAPGSWERVDPEPYYFTDTGSANNIQITTGDSITALADITGRILFVKIAAANTSATVNMLVDTAPTATLIKYGATAIEADDIRVGMIAALLYDGTNFQLLNPAITPNNTFTGKATVTGLSVATQDVTLSGLTAPDSVQVWYVCVTGDAGYSTGDKLDVNAVIADYDLGDSEEGPYISVSTRGNIVHLEAVVGAAAVYTTQRGTGTDQTTFTPANWTITVIGWE